MSENEQQVGPVSINGSMSNGHNIDHSDGNSNGHTDKVQQNIIVSENFENDEESNDKEIEIIDSYSTEQELEEYRKLREKKIKLKNNHNIVNINNDNNNNEIKTEEELEKDDKQEEISWKKGSLNSSSVGSLLRFFQSQFFDTWISVSYLYRYPSPGIHDYLCNALYSMPDDEIEFYLVQLW